MKANLPKRVKSADYSVMRDEVCQIVCWCSCIVMQRVFGMGAERQNRMADIIQAVQNQYGADILLYGDRIALERMQARARAVGMNDTMPWPDEPDAPVVNSKAYKEYVMSQKQKQEAATLGWCIYGICLHKAMKFGEKRYAILYDRVLDLIKEYQENAATCEFDKSGVQYANKDYAFDVICKAANRIFKQECRVITDDEAENRIRNDEAVNRIAYGAIELLKQKQNDRIDALNAAGKFDKFRDMEITNFANANTGRLKFVV